MDGQCKFDERHDDDSANYTSESIDLPRLAALVAAGHVATLLQDANADPLVRQITLGHAPSGANGALGMTTAYIHTRPRTHRQEILRALRLWPQSLELANHWCKEARND